MKPVQTTHLVTGEVKDPLLPVTLKLPMKTSKIWFGIFTITAALLAHAQAQSYLTNGLIAFYPLNGNANDVVGANNGTVVGATPTTNRFGDSGHAYSFDGTTYIQCPDAGLPSGDSPRSVCLWVNIASFGGVQITFPFGYGVATASSAFYATVDTVNAGGPYITVGQAGGGDAPRWNGPTTNVWYQIAVTYSNSTATLYVNGSNVGQAPRSYATALTGNFFIGASYQGSAGPPSFFGAISDVRIYDRALSSNELQQLYAYESTPPQNFLTNGLVAYYPFNGNPNDASGNGNNGTVSNATLTADRFGFTNGAYHFTNDVSSAIAVSDSPALNLGNQFSVSCWFKYEQPWTFHGESLVYQFKYPQFNGWILAVNQDHSMHGAGMYGIVFQGNTNQAVYIVPYSFLTSWNQLVGVYDGAAVNLYVNGTFVGQQAASAVGHAPVNLVIGGSANPVSGAYSRDIDNVRIYDRALSSNEVMQLYAYESTPPQTLLANGLVAYYPFNGNVNDASGNGNNGNLQTGIGFGADRFGNPQSALYFTNGAAGEMTTTQLQGAGNDFALSLWFNLPTNYLNLGPQYLVCLTDTQTGGWGEVDKVLQVGTPGQSNELFFYLYPGQQVFLPSPNPEADGQWHHAVASLSSLGMMLYLDGNLVATNPNNLSQGFSGFWRIRPGQGFVDEVRIYDRALLTNEVQQLYAFERGTNPPSIIAQPQPLTVNAGDIVLFSVAAIGSPSLAYQWTLNGTNIFTATGSSLTISNVAQTNLGTYAVIVTNAFGSITSSNAMLSMYPFLAVPFGGVVTDWGYSPTLSVQAWGTGPLTYQWYDNGVAISGATNASLTLTSIQFTNAGLYSVVVTSPLGSVTNTPEQVVVNPAGVSIGLYAGVTVTGTVGYTYKIQATTDLSNSNSWSTVAILTLQDPVELWVDTTVNTTSSGNPRRFYRVLPGP